MGLAISNCSVPDSEPTPDASVSMPVATPTPDAPSEMTDSEVTPVASKIPSTTPKINAMTESAKQARVVSVTARGEPGGYTLSVTIESQDTGCDQYADWWEVVASDGKLLYRRVLLHSHTTEQPFTRSGGPVDVQPDDTVTVRAHMNATGYSGVALRGSIAAGFETEINASEFSPELEQFTPLPDGCAF